MSEELRQGENLRPINSNRMDEQRNLPQGVVTAVFTDIVKSTPMKEQMFGATSAERDETYRKRVKEPHDKIVQEQSEKFEGNIVKDTGDGFFIVFRDPEKAVLFGTCLLDALRHPTIQTPKEPLRVKIGIHTGNATPSGNDYVGRTPDKAARVMGMAKGGQVVVSDETRTLVRGKVSGLKFKSIGNRHLRGIGQEELFVVYRKRWWSSVATPKNRWFLSIMAILLGVIAVGWIKLACDVRKGAALRSSGHLSSAERLLSDALRRAKIMPFTSYLRMSALYELGITQSLQGNHRAASNSFSLCRTQAIISKDEEMYASANTKQADLLRALGYVESALTLYRQSEAISIKLQNSNLLARVYRGLGDLARGEGSNTVAISHYAKAFATFKAVNDKQAQATVLQNVAEMYYFAGDSVEARKHYLEAISLFSEVGEPVGQIGALNGLAQLELLLGDIDNARRHFAAAKGLASAIGNTPGVAQAEEGLGRVEMLHGNTSSAKRHFSSAYEYFQTAGNALGKAHALVELGRLDHHAGRSDEARRQLREARDVYHSIRDRIGEASVLLQLGTLEVGQGRLQLGKHEIENAIRLYQEERYSIGEAQSLLALGQLARISNELDDAKSKILKALELFRTDSPSNEHVSGQAQALFELGYVDFIGGRHGSSQTNLSHAMQLFKQLNDKLGEANVNWNLGMVESFAGRNESAKRHFSEALGIFQSIGAKSGEARSEEMLADIYVKQGDYRRARAGYERAGKLFDDLSMEDEAKVCNKKAHSLPSK